jgi:hypothetical protein
LFHGIEMICKFERKIEILFDEDYRHFAFFTQFVDDTTYILDDVRLNAFGRLVQE